MSTATIPFIARSGAMQGARDAAGSYSGFVSLTPIDSDVGLAEACRLYWLFESISFVPAGTVTFGAGTNTFSKTISAPVTTGSPDSAVSNGIAVTAGTPETTKEPAYRCDDTSNTDIIDLTQSWNIPTLSQEQGTFKFNLYFVSGEWRLYYTFAFEISAYDPDEDVAKKLLINSNSTPSGDSVALSDGTFSLFGYTIPWYAYKEDADPLLSASGAGLSCSTVEWSF